ncbi:hypothetical protein ACWCXX_40050 [Streptomyces sp. NPDC001732]
MSLVLMFFTPQVAKIQFVNAASATLGTEFVKKAFTGLVTGIGAVGAGSLQVYKTVYETDIEDLKGYAESAWNGLSDISRKGFETAVALSMEVDSTIRGLSDDIWDSITGVFDKFHEAYKSTIIGEIYTVSFKGSTAADFKFNYPYRAVFSTSTWHPEPMQVFSSTWSSINDGTSGYIKLGKFELKTNSSYDRKQMIKAGESGSLSAIISLSHAYSAVPFEFKVINVLTGNDVNVFAPDDSAIYDQTLKKLKEQDIPRMKDAGVVLPVPTGVLPGIEAGTKDVDVVFKDGIPIDKSTGLAIPNVKYPDIVWKNPSITWENDIPKVDGGIGVQDLTKPGDVAINPDLTGISGLLKGILDAIKAIPTAFMDLLKALFIPTTLAASLSNMVDMGNKLVLLPDFSFLKGSVGSCMRSDIKISIYGKSLTIVSMDYLLQASSYYMPIMRGLLWFLFGWYAYRKIIAMLNKVDGVRN